MSDRLRRRTTRLRALGLPVTHPAWALASGTQDEQRAAILRGIIDRERRRHWEFVRRKFAAHMYDPPLGW